MEILFWIADGYQYFVYSGLPARGQLAEDRSLFLRKFVYSRVDDCSS